MSHQHKKMKNNTVIKLIKQHPTKIFTLTIIKSN